MEGEDGGRQGGWGRGGRGGSEGMGGGGRWARHATQPGRQTHRRHSDITLDLLVINLKSRERPVIGYMLSELRPDAENPDEALLFLAGRVIRQAFSISPLRSLFQRRGAVNQHDQQLSPANQ